MIELWKYLDPYTTVVESWIETTPSDYLKIFTITTPLKKAPTPELLVVGGLSTIIESFAPFLAEASRFFNIYYLETREKISSRLSDEAKFSMDDFSTDLAIVTERLFNNGNQYVIFGYSMGAAIVMDGFPKMKHKPLSLILLSPTASFEYPKWSLFLMRHSLWMKSGWMKWVGKWYMGRFVVNRKEDPDMYAISMKAIDSADPPKVKKTILAIHDYKIWDKLEKIKCKTLVVATSKDGIHVKDEVEKIAAMIPGAEYLDLETNDRTHGPEMSKLVMGFLNQDYR